MPVRDVTLIEYASPDLIPANLRPVAALDYSGATPPDAIQAVGATWASIESSMNPRIVQFGAVRYAAGAATPANLLPVAAVLPDVT